MSDIKDTVKHKLVNIMDGYFQWRLRLYHGEVDVEKGNFIDQILNIKELAIIDREAKLPLLTDDWIGEGWVKEVE